MVRFIRRWLVAASYVLVFLGSAQAQSQSITIGSNVIWSSDSKNGNLLSAQIAKLTEAATIQSLSFYVTAASGNLILGIYDATGPSGGPGTLKASTASFTPTKGWNTAKVVTHVSLAAGSYWLAFLPSSNALGFAEIRVTGNCKYYSYAYGSLPGKFSTSPASCNPTTRSFYATLTLASTSPSAVNGACGSSNGESLASVPTANLCSTGTASTVSGSGPWSWSCAGSGGGTTATCSALDPPPPVNGACGSANGGTVSTAPTANLCTAGSASTVSGSGPWSWTCAGSNGGSTASCTDKLASTGSTPATGSTGSTGATGSDPTSGVLPSYNDAYANWKNAGLQSVGGIPERTTVCATVNPSGKTPPAAEDDASHINAAVAACPAGEVVQLSAGVFNIDVSENVQIYNGITLRGSGNCAGSTPYSLCATQIVRPNGLLKYDQGACGTSTTHTNPCNSLPLIYVSNSPRYTSDWGGCNDGVVADCLAPYATVAADATQGQTTIQVNNTSIFSAGMWVLINEATAAAFQTDPVHRAAYGGSSGQVFASPDAFTTTGGPASGRTVYHYFNPSTDNDATSASAAEEESFQYSGFVDRPYGEMHLIKSVGAGPCPGANCTITFDDPIMVAFRESGGHNALVFLPATTSGVYTPVVTGVGIENLTVGRGDQSNITLYFCADCWVKNVESYGWEGGAVEVIASARTELNNVYGYECWNSVNSGVEYVFDFDEGSTEIMLDNSISRFGGKNMTNRGGGAGSVVAYNYMDAPWYDRNSGIGNYWIDLSANATHFPGSHMVLFEGNQVVNMDGDDTHGSGADYMVFYRNWSTGYRSPFTDPETGAAVSDLAGTGELSCPSGPSSCTSVTGAGNLRTAGPMAYNYWYAFVGNVMGWPTYSTAARGWSYDRTFSAGSLSIWESGTVSGEFTTDPNLSNFNFMFRDGNYDTVTGGVTWNSSAHALPNSLYLSSAPSFFAAGASCSYPWPWVTPTGASQLLNASGPGSCSTYSGLPAKARWQAGTPLGQP